MQNAATVRELSDKFFKGNERPAGPGTTDQMQAVTEREMNLTPLAAARRSTPDTEFIMPAIANIAQASENENNQPEGLHPRGSFVDVKA